MKFQIPFYRNFKYFDKDKIEINIIYKPKIKELYDFLSEYKDYRINIITTVPLDEKDFTILGALAEIYSNISVRSVIYNKEIEEKFNSLNIPHYYQYICCDWENLLGFCSLNVTDIRIGGNLGFMMRIASDFTKKKGIRLRCFCNYCEKKWDSIDTIKNFFIRPEDIPYYAQFIDTFELVDVNGNKGYNTLYEIYGMEHKWDGKLKDIIYNYDGEEYNNTIILEFGEYRSRCGRKCLIEPYSCQICNRIIELSQSFHQKNIRIKKEDI